LAFFYIASKRQCTNNEKKKERKKKTQHTTFPVSPVTDGQHSCRFNNYLSKRKGFIVIPGSSTEGKSEMSIRYKD
jgi:hypothetical protein